MSLISNILLIFAACAFCVRSQGIAFPDESNESNCRTHTHLEGVCIRLDNCPNAIRQLREGKNPKICGYQKYVPIVCCPKLEPIRGLFVRAPVIDFKCGNRTTLTDYFTLPTFSRRRRQAGIVNGNRPSVSSGAWPWIETSDQRWPDYPLELNVVGGIEATPEQWPWMALLGHNTSSNSYSWFCSAVLINKKWLLTAAHCFQRGLPDIVRLGEHDFDSLSDQAPHTDHFIERVVVYPEYRVNGSPSSYHDLALIELKKQVPLTSWQWPICLPWGLDAKELPVGDTLTITGWGATKFGGEFTSILQEADVEVFPASTCNSSYSILHTFSSRWPQGITEDHYICAGHKEGGVDSCDGDSGGPAVQYDFAKDSWVIHGVVSQGYACALKKFPGLYVNLAKTKYLTWIKRTAF